MCYYTERYAAARGDLSDSDSDNGQSANEDENANPYLLEGKYVDEEDWERYGVSFTFDISLNVRDMCPSSLVMTAREYHKGQLKVSLKSDKPRRV